MKIELLNDPYRQNGWGNQPKASGWRNVNRANNDAVEILRRIILLETAQKGETVNNGNPPFEIPIDKYTIPNPYTTYPQDNVVSAPIRNWRSFMANEAKNNAEQHNDKMDVNNKAHYSDIEEKLFNFQKEFEDFIPEAKYIPDENGGSTLTVGYGSTKYWNEDGTYRDLKIGEKWTEEEAKEQNHRAYKFDILPWIKSENGLGLKHFDTYPEDLKFNILDPVYNVKRTSLSRTKSPNWRNALDYYEANGLYNDPNYDTWQINKHGNWSTSNKGRLGLRSKMRQISKDIKEEDYIGVKYFPKEKVDSLNKVYKEKIDNYGK